MNFDCITEKGAINQIAEYVGMFSASRVFIVADKNTYPVAGEKAERLLGESKIEVSKHIFEDTQLEPDERAVGSLMLHFDSESELILGIGSGVINDTCKLLAHQTGKPYIIIATAPSMDGYAAPLSSMIRDRLKVSIPTKRADLIIADIDIIKNAPLQMLKAGLGDMLAKYVSICEWRIGALITGEYYDEEIASSVRSALKKCVDNANGLISREEEAVRAVFEGLILTGEAMKKAGVSRPASGAEHYFSHLWDMRGLEFGTPMMLHGLQCATATRICVQMYHRLKNVRPDRIKALQYVERFDKNAWNEALRDFLGRASEALIALEEREGKYDLQKHAKRLEIIIEKYDDILRIIDEELPDPETLDALFEMLSLPTASPEKGVMEMTVKAGKDIRDKYVLTRLLWDLGILDEFCNDLTL